MPKHSSRKGNDRQPQNDLDVEFMEFKAATLLAYSQMMRQRVILLNAYVQAIERFRAHILHVLAEQKK